MTSYVLRRRAREDLKEIWRFTADKWGEQQAEAYHGQIIAALERLARRPQLGREFSNVRPGYRRYSVRAHAVFYLRTKKKTLDVVRILHQRRDLPSHL